MSDATNAIFQSYAREDAARRMANPLRAAGVGVWLDQNEPRTVRAGHLHDDTRT